MRNNREEERENKTRHHLKIGERFALSDNWQNEGGVVCVWVALEECREET